MAVFVNICPFCLISFTILLSNVSQCGLLPRLTVFVEHCIISVVIIEVKEQGQTAVFVIFCMFLLNLQFTFAF